MLFDPRITDFFTDCNEVNSVSDLHDLLTDITHRLEFDQFALNHHVDLIGPPEDAISVMNYDRAWVERAFANQYYVDDPIHAASTKAGFGFLWSQVPTMLVLTRRQRMILEDARAFGLCEGFTVPVHLPGEYRGTCSFGARSINASRTLLLAAQLAGLCAFEAARRLVRTRRGGTELIGIPRLSPRQLDCLIFVARGKSDKAIAQILGLSPATVHQHIGEAMRRYDVVTRTQLIVRALFDSQICYRETLRR